MHEYVCIFCGECGMRSDRCSEHHACAGVYVKQVLCASAYKFAYTLATGWAYALMYVQFVHLALGNKDWGFQLVYESTCCLAWGFIFDRMKSVSSLFWTWAGVYVGVGVCIRTRTHTLHRWVTRLWAQGSGWDTWRARESRWTKSRHICILICVQSTYVYIYAKMWDEILD